ncbi:hypothetical protein BJ875DRAFT_377679, partial [Amylocarpus encephaloides]
LTVMPVPTAPLHPSIPDVENDPVEISTHFSDFTNVLDPVAISLPCGTVHMKLTTLRWREEN